MTRVLMISKACIVGAYQRKLEEIAAFSDIDLSVIVPTHWDDTALERAHTNGYQLIVESIPFNGNFHLHYYPQLWQHIEAIKPDILHIDEEPYNFATYHALQQAKRAGVCVLFFSWQNIYRRYPPPFSWMEQAVINQSDAAIVGNTESVDVWQSKGYTGLIKIIPQFGVDPELFQKTTLDKKNQPFTIGFAGRLVPEKGLDLLFEAALNLAGKWRIRLAGSGPYERVLRTQAGVLNIGGQVHFDGVISSIEMPAFYQQLDVLVLPSLTRANWKEQFGRVLIEAMACGVPVIGSDSGAIPEVIGDAGLIFPEGDIKALSLCLSALQGSDVRETLINRGLARVKTHYTQQHIAQQTVEVYRTLV